MERLVITLEELRQDKRDLTTFAEAALERLAAAHEELELLEVKRAAWENRAWRTLTLAGEIRLELEAARLGPGA